MYLGNRALGTTITIPCVTCSATGAAVDADSAPTFRIYKNGYGVPVLTGTFTIMDSSSTTGLYTATVLLSLLNGFARRREYIVYVESVVSSVTKTVLYYFQID